MYCLTCVCTVFVTQWHNAWRMYHMKIQTAVFSVIGPSNLNGQQRRFGLDLLLQSSGGLCRQTQNAPPKHSLPCMYQTIRCPDSDHLINPHHCEHLKSHTKNYSEQKHWWKFHVAKTELYKSTIYFYTVYNITALCGGIVLEEALDLSFDRLLIMMMIKYHILFPPTVNTVI